MPGHWQLRELAGAYVNGNGRKTGELTKWGLNGVKANYPMALDEDDHRLFVVARRPLFPMVLDTNTSKEVARVPVGGSSDDVYYDAERKRIYALGGEGFISVIQQNAPDHYTEQLLPQPAQFSVLAS